ncbi:DNA-packaging protein FI [Escherichia coli]|uniref:DNA-packaging protein FI n=1 Tax=Escherichia coli TaxID=562 RepID=UPI003FA1AA84
MHFTPRGMNLWHLCCRERRFVSLPSPENALTGHENEVVSAQTDTVTDTAALVTVVALVTLHTDALHATRDEPVAFVLPGTAFRVSAGVAAEMTERGLARMQ